MKFDISFRKFKTISMSLQESRTETVTLCSGPGLENYYKEEAKLEVRYADCRKQFDRIAPAVIFYYTLTTNASIWDITGTPMLIESKIFVPV